MDNRLRTDVDEEDEIPDSGDESGPLGRLLEHETGSNPSESEGATTPSNTPGPSAVPTEYAPGTREHDDDRDG